MIENFLRSQDAAWPDLVRALLPEIHPVDRAAVRIWFSFFPLGFHEIVEREGAHKDFLALYQARGTYRLSEMVDTSHWFLCGSAYWPEVKRAILNPPALRGGMLELIRDTASATGKPLDLVTGLAAVGYMTLRQTGYARFGEPAPPKAPARTPERVLAARATDKKNWLAQRTPRVIFREEQEDGWFPVLRGQEITTAAEQDKRPYHLQDSRCFENMGPIPVECRSGKCGTCWVGVLGGNENLSPMADWERKRLAHFGYFDSGFESLEDTRPLVRLACQAQAVGSVSIVIPPWCGVPARGRGAS